MPITSNDVFSFCWTLFIHVKANFPAISNDLVNSYHLLLACIDFCYGNALVAENAKDLLNPQFSGTSGRLIESKHKSIDHKPSTTNSSTASCLFAELPNGYEAGDYKPENVACIIQSLCSKYDGIFVDAKGTACSSLFAARKSCRLAQLQESRNIGGSRTSSA